MNNKIFLTAPFIIILFCGNSFSQNINREHHECCEGYECSIVDEKNNFQTQANPERVGIDTLVCGQMYVVYSGSSYATNLNNIFSTSNIFIIKGIADTVWIFGTGYGGRDTLTSPQYTSTRPALSDALDADSVIRYYFGINPANAKLNYIVPHKHFDHINWEFVTSLFDTIGYSRSNSNIYVHSNDYFGAYNNCSVLDQTLVQSIGASSDVSCTTLLMTFTSAMGVWEVYKGDINHTTGTINMDNPTYKIRLEGAAATPGCTFPNNWYELGVHKSMDNYIDTVFCSPMSNIQNNSQPEISVSIFPNPASNILYFKYENFSNPIIAIKIINVLGQELINKQIQARENTIDVSSLQSGIYFVEALSLNERIIKKIIIQN